MKRINKICHYGQSTTEFVTMFGPLPNLPEIEIVKVKNCTFNLITSKIIYRF